MQVKVVSDGLVILDQGRTRWVIAESAAEAVTRFNEYDCADKRIKVLLLGVRGGKGRAPLNLVMQEIGRDLTGDISRALFGKLASGSLEVKAVR